MNLKKINCDSNLKTEEVYRMWSKMEVLIKLNNNGETNTPPPNQPLNFYTFHVKRACLII
jgi:hypothetical protein